MSAMPNSLGRFQAVLSAGWVLLGLGGWLYASAKNVPAGAAFAVAAAFLFEFPFYLSPGFDAVRQRMEGLGRTRLAALLTATAVLPYLIYSVPVGTVRVEGFLAVLGVAAVVSFWYLVLPARPWSDAALLVLVAAILLSGIFDWVYVSPVPKVSISLLGHIMLIRTAAWTMLAIRPGSVDEPVNARFGFWPDRTEWMTGLRYFAMLLPVVSVVYWGLGLVRLRPQPLNPALALATFFGILWVVALSEEFFFRGLLQPWLGRWTGSARAGLVLASVLFGSAHLGFQHHFPNWRFATVAAIAGFFYGLAWQRARSVQASMVTHALTVTLWRVFLQ
jgi:membrane protease YdiL (CAAX protease family)